MRSDSVFSTSSVQAYLILVFLCGAALAASIQPATRIALLHASDISYFSGLFPISFVLLFGLFSINRGAIIASNAGPRISRIKLVLRSLEHIVYGLVLVSPYLIYSRALLPNTAVDIFTLALYSIVSSLFFCLLSFRLERRGDHWKRGAFLLRYGSFFAFCLVPFGLGISHSSLSFLVVASPVGHATRLIGGASALELATGFFVPLLGILWILTRRQRFDRRPHAV